MENLVNQAQAHSALRQSQKHCVTRGELYTVKDVNWLLYRSKPTFINQIQPVTTVRLRDKHRILTSTKYKYRTLNLGDRNVV